MVRDQLVVVGDLIGEGSAQEQAVVGETSNLAARLQALATPTSPVIGAGTRHQIASRAAQAPAPSVRFFGYS
jgi:class 3 adenylate cyclase